MIDRLTQRKRTKGIKGQSDRGTDRLTYRLMNIEMNTQTDKLIPFLVSLYKLVAQLNEYYLNYTYLFS